MADLRKAELFPADAFGLFYLQITRIPGGWHRHAEYEIFYHMHSKIPSEISDSTVRALRGFCVSRNGDQISIIPFSSFGIGRGRFSFQSAYFCKARTTKFCF